MIRKLPNDFKVVKKTNKYGVEVTLKLNDEEFAKGAMFDTEKDAHTAGHLVLAAVRTVRREYGLDNTK